MMQPLRFLINGEWRSSERKRTLYNPFTKQSVGEVYQASDTDIADAIHAATAAFQVTRKLPAYRRAEVLLAIAREIEADKGRFAELITAETGKPITLSRTEVERSIFTFIIASEEAKRIEGNVLQLDLAQHSEDRIGIVRRFPIGPIGAITPFNFPLNLVAHKVAPAIAAGNTVVLKPASSASMTALLLAEVIHKTTLPKGAFNVAPCSSHEAEQLATNEYIKLISFTGSPAVGWGLKAKAGKKKVVLELGGNAGVIVDKDANLYYALKRIVQGAYGNAGQSCIAVQRIYVHSDLYKVFTERLLEATKSVVVGNPMDEATLVGPMIDEEAAQKAEGWIKEAVAAGARLLCGGSRKGAVLEPTVLAEVKPDMKVSCEEVFAPVVTVEPFDSFEQAIAMANNSVYGLQAGVFSNNFKNIMYAYQELEVGGVVINDSPTYRIDHMPYGGMKNSGFGREGIRNAIEEMTEMKLMAMNLGQMDQ